MKTAKRNRQKIDPINILIYIFFGILSLCVLYPIWSIISASLTSAEEISATGFSLWPKQPTLDSYAYLFKTISSLLKAYATTIFVAVSGTLIGVLTCSAYAYVLSRKNFPLRRVLAFIAMFTMYFSGGMGATYIVIVKILNLKNNILALILPSAFSVMNVVIVRSFFDQLPYGLVESAKLDGANEYGVYFRIMLPLAKPALATVCLTLFVTYWNAYYEAMMYMDTGKYTTIQLLLQRMMQKVDFVKQYASSGLVSSADLPSEGLRMAMCVLTLLPMLCVFPFFQKYFVKGMAIGSVKG